MRRDQLTQRGDNTLLSAYFIPKAGCGFAGARPDADNACASEFNIDPTTPMAVLTSTENQMLLAEAQFRSGQSGAALGTLNAYRQSVGEATVNPSGIGILTAILSEKYFHLFLNPEVFFDYQRNCFPNFDIPYADATHHYVPARLPYGYTERITNPNVGDFPSATNNDFLNPLFPTRQLDVTGASCFGQKGRPTG